MPRYYFHLCTDRGLEKDRDGVEFPDLEHAWREARRAIPDMAADFLKDGRDPGGFYFQITGADGVVLTEAFFQDVLRAAPRN